MIKVQPYHFFWIYFLLVISFCISFLKIRQSMKESKYVGAKVSKLKYIGSLGFGGRLGNQVWRIASLYGIGRYTGRKIFFQNFAFEDQRDGYFVNLTEIGETFPNLLPHIYVKNPEQSNIKNISFALNCCKFDYPEKLTNISDEYVQIDGDYLQSYKFFHPYETEIKSIFKCSPTVMSSIKNYSNNLFQENNSKKLCAYIRRGDFLTDLMLESKVDFVIPAIDYAYSYYKQKKINKSDNTNISLVFIGDDHVFAKNLSLDKQNFDNIYYPQLNSPSEDLCFGINFCDSMILTASGSTFGWWMAYLMKSEGPVFYNSQVTDNGDHSKDIHDFDYFPKDWIKLTIKEKKAFEETQWWHERHSLLPDLPSKEL